jgi:hypothetical protein
MVAAVGQHEAGAHRIERVVAERQSRRLADHQLALSLGIRGLKHLDRQIEGHHTS